MANSKLKTCKHCGAEIAKSAKVCPQCGGKNAKPIFLRPWFIILVVVIIIIIAAGGKGSKSNETQQIGTVSQTPSTGAADSSTKTGTSEKTEKNEKTNESTPEPKSIYSVGDILQDGNVQIVYAASGDYISDNQFLQPKDGYKYIFLKLAFINTGKQDTSISFYSFDAYADGYSVDMFYGGEDSLSATLSAGRSTMGYIYFEVPVDAQEIEIEYTPNVFMDKKIKFVFEGDQDSGYVLEANKSRTDGALQVGETYENSSL